MTIQEWMAYNLMVWPCYFILCQAGWKKRINYQPPPPLLHAHYYERTKTFSLIVRLAKNIHGTGNISLLDSDLCVLHGFFYINTKVLYGYYLINKSWYWTWYIDDEKIKARFTEQDIGALDEFCGEIEKVPLNIFAMK